VRLVGCHEKLCDPRKKRFRDQWLLVAISG
jgi:hypothetical protein